MASQDSDAKFVFSNLNKQFILIAKTNVITDISKFEKLILVIIPICKIWNSYILMSKYLHKNKWIIKFLRSQTLANIRWIRLEDNIYQCVTYQVFMYCLMATTIFSYTYNSIFWLRSSNHNNNCYSVYFLSLQRIFSRTLRRIKIYLIWWYREQISC